MENEYLVILMHRLLFLVGCMLCFCVRVTGQHLHTGDIPALRKQPGRVLPDTTCLQVLLTLSNTFTLLPGGKPHDLDTALLLAQAELLRALNLYGTLQFPALQEVYLLDANEARNFSSAIRQYQQYRTTRDSLLGDNKTLFDARYEVAAKEKDLQLKEQNIAMLTRQGQVQKNKLEKAQLVKVIIMAGIIVLVFIILILLYNRYRFRKQSYRQLRLQQQEISVQNNSLQSLMATQHKLLGEKEWLLKEIHHRVKNNLQIVMSLLNTQSAHLQNDAAISAIHESRRRMQAISLIHQKLYQNENVSVVDMDAYIHELVEYVVDGFPHIVTIYFDICIAPIALNVSQAVPIGLILNEALTNAIKYAFDKSPAGVITIAMDYLPNGNLLLTVSDNGKGLPPEFDIDKNGAMGMTLIQTLCRQLNGTLELRNEDGVAVMITFTPPR